ncbi:hypothetical protein [Roseicella aquatilis]|uniref:Uncharacterized protein n=1 Tax=Roseicella aquatilis TaxID=2527868 RepID=A0A4R4D4P2_9PROT|nr:hypothetical protein [Roseicella aquatilis]TCZ53193.1 hypothetical protein EXY23_25170 [Roseicella aquatilis]
MRTLVPVSPQRAVDTLAEVSPTMQAAAPVVPVAPVAPAPADTGVPNPSLRLDPALGLVVMEFRDRQGRTETLPTEKELEAYRSAGRRPEVLPGRVLSVTAPAAAPQEGRPRQDDAAS